MRFIWSCSCSISSAFLRRLQKQLVFCGIVLQFVHYKYCKDISGHKAGRSDPPFCRLYRLLHRCHNQVSQSEWSQWASVGRSSRPCFHGQGTSTGSWQYEDTSLTVSSNLHLLWAEHVCAVTCLLSLLNECAGVCSAEFLSSPEVKGWTAKARGPKAPRGVFYFFTLWSGLT